MPRSASQDSVIRSPFIRSLTLSSITGAELWLKLESLQFTSSFKERGARTSCSTLDGRTSASAA